MMWSTERRKINVRLWSIESKMKLEVISWCMSSLGLRLSSVIFGWFHILPQLFDDNLIDIHA